MTDLPGFLPPAVEGHAGRIRSLDVGGVKVLAFLGRTHYYEGPRYRGSRPRCSGRCRGRLPHSRAHQCLRQPAASNGSRRSGADLSDHLNLTWRTPLVGPRFVDLTNTYSPRLRAIVQAVDPSITEGVYAMFPGPQYETPAEVRMAGVLGADLVGMSTVLEAIAARAEGCEVLGLSLVTNLAAGLGDELVDGGARSRTCGCRPDGRPARAGSSTAMNPDLQARVAAWIADDVDPEAAAELQALLDAERFRRPPRRTRRPVQWPPDVRHCGPARADPAPANGMNRTVVRRAAAGIWPTWLTRAHAFPRPAGGRGGLRRAPRLP